MPQRELVPRSRRCPRDHRGLADRLQHQPAPFGLGLRYARGIRFISPGACPWRDDNKRPTWAKSATRTLLLSDQSWGAGQINYTIVGNTVNISQRFEALGKDIATDIPLTILVSDSVREAAEAEFEFQLVGDMPVKGRAGAIRV